MGRWLYHVRFVVRRVAVLREGRASHVQANRKGEDAPAERGDFRVWFRAVERAALPRQGHAVNGGRGAGAQVGHRGELQG